MLPTIGWPNFLTSTPIRIPNHTHATITLRHRICQHLRFYNTNERSHALQVKMIFLQVKMCGSVFAISLQVLVTLMLLSRLQGKVLAPSHLQAMAGLPFMLACNITMETGEALEQVLWLDMTNKTILHYQPDKHVTKVDGVELSQQTKGQQAHTSVITIRRAGPANEGCYQCLFDVYPSGQQRGRTCLSLTAKVELMDNKTVVSGKPVTFLCKYILSKRVRQVLWKKTAEQGDTATVASYVRNDRPSVETPFKDRVTLNPSLGQSKLSIHQAQTEDEGCYTCEFHTYPDGIKSATACLSVYGCAGGQGGAGCAGGQGGAGWADVQGGGGCAGGQADDHHSSADGLEDPHSGMSSKALTRTSSLAVLRQTDSLEMTSAIKSRQTGSSGTTSMVVSRQTGTPGKTSVVVTTDRELGDNLRGCIRIDRKFIGHKTGLTKDKGKTSGTDSAGTGRLESTEAGGLDGAGLGMLAARTDIKGVSSRLEASLKGLGKASTSSRAALITTGNIYVASMMAEDSGVAANLSEDTGVASILTEDTGRAAILSEDTGGAAFLSKDTGLAAILSEDTGLAAMMGRESGMGIVEANCSAVSRPVAEISWNVEGHNQTLGPAVTSFFQLGDGTTMVVSSIQLQTELLDDELVKCEVRHQGLVSAIYVTLNKCE
ncbi:Nectin-1 [Anabarilius grahami]|uniref:Nectin-1 n=1 Tax=Anabarilius grahami TaxID=495550 RepID=A0A3N0Y9W7_ANAGA|nr:Nectin-1 [Anabarilius grahami]